MYYVIFVRSPISVMLGNKNRNPFRVERCLPGYRASFYSYGWAHSRFLVRTPKIMPAQTPQQCRSTATAVTTMTTTDHQSTRRHQDQDITGPRPNFFPQSTAGARRQGVSEVVAGVEDHATSLLRQAPGGVGSTAGMPLPKYWRIQERGRKAPGDLLSTPCKPYTPAKPQTLKL